ncbi:MAG: uncharacterized protein K0S16_2114 [Moraxellaceae bacterium]|nr:uncharacterized protein [Moraxellaceae bacterium]
MRLLAVLFMALALAACASSKGFDRGALRSKMVEQKAVTEEDIQRTLSLKPQLPQPYRLAVYFMPAKSYWRAPFAWTREDKEKIVQAASGISGVADVVLVNDTFASSADIKAVRLAAARAGADAVLVVDGVASIDRYNNPLGMTYIALVTPLFVPGTVMDGLFLANASMWDVRNQYLYLSIEAEGQARKVAPPYFLEEGHVVANAKARGLDELARDLGTRLQRMSVR